MNLPATPKVNFNLPRVQVKGGGSAAVANRNAHAITRGLENAVRNLAASGQLSNSVHLDRLNIRIPPGASERQIAESIQRALEQSMPKSGGGR